MLTETFDRSFSAPIFWSIVENWPWLRASIAFNNLLTACFWLLHSSESLVVAQGTALYAAGWTFTYAAVPPLVYTLFLLGSLLIEVLRTLLPGAPRPEPPAETGEE